MSADRRAFAIVRVWIGKHDEGWTPAAELAETFTVVEAAYDPWQGALLAETMEQRRLTAVQVPQSDSRMQPAERLQPAPNRCATHALCSPATVIYRCNGARLDRHQGPASEAPRRARRPHPRIRSRRGMTTEFLHPTR